MSGGVISDKLGCWSQVSRCCGHPHGLLFMSRFAFRLNDCMDLFLFLLFFFLILVINLAELSICSCAGAGRLVDLGILLTVKLAV